MSTQNPGGSFPAELADRLHSAAIHLLRHARQVDAEAGLTASRLSLLSVLVFGGPKTLGALAIAEQVRPPTITGLVRGLEEDGLVRTNRSRQDRRVVQASATSKGRRLLKRARRRRGEVIAALLAKTGKSERAQLERAVAVLERALCERAPAAP